MKKARLVKKSMEITAMNRRMKVVKVKSTGKTNKICQVLKTILTQKTKSKVHPKTKAKWV